MKKWEMPQVRIDQFVANEYVSSCSISGEGSGSTITISCDWHGEEDNNPSHYGSTDNCDMTFTFPLSAWETVLGNGATGAHGWITTDGRTGSGRTAPTYNDGVDSTWGEYCLEVWKTDKRYVYNITKLKAPTPFFQPSYMWSYVYVGNMQSNHFVMGTANPNS